MTRYYWALTCVVAIVLSAAAVAAGYELGPGYASGCTPPTLATWPERPPRVPALSPSEKPNFIVIQVDDMGWDDIGLHHPRGPDGVSSAGAQTPNIDKLIKNGMSFTNFYSSSLCAMGRAQLLTGRDYPRTGNLFNGLGYDAINLGEATMGNVMQQAGYVTAHYGKWHNSRSLGYEPWWRGFNDSWLPSDTYLQLDNLMRHNSRYVQTKGLVEQIMADKIIGFMKRREKDKQPFLQYYAPYAIHATPFNKELINWERDVARNKTAQASIYFRPEPYRSMILNQQPPPGAQNAGVWAFLMYLDDVLGKIFNYVNRSPLLRKNTYIMLTTDNGPGLPFVSNLTERLQRLPSGMRGDKNKNDPEGVGAANNEGALRTHLAVWGPGVSSGRVSDTLTSLDDVLPTVADLAGATDTRHEPWSGRSFANLLQPNGSPTPEQERRFHFILVVNAIPQQCLVMSRLITSLLPTLGPDGEVVKPQPLLVYTEGGSNVMKDCIVGRYGDYKWFGTNDKVYRLTNGSHIEKLCNEVVDEQSRRDLAAQFNKAAEAWWNSVVMEPHSFVKPVYMVGLRGFGSGVDEPTNVEAPGTTVLQRGGSMAVRDGGVAFSAVDDFGCWKIRPVTGGTYVVVLMYYTVNMTNVVNMTVMTNMTALVPVFQMDFWQNGKRRGGKIVKALPTNPTGEPFGSVVLRASNGSTKTEFCLRLIDVVPENSSNSSNVSAGSDTATRGVTSRGMWAASAGIRGGANGSSGTDRAWQFQLLNTRFVRVSRPRPTESGQDKGKIVSPATDFVATATATGVPLGMPPSAIGALGTMAEPAAYENFKPSAAMLEFERRVRHETITNALEDYRAISGAAQVAAATLNSPQRQWRQLQQKYNWLDGQILFRSLYRACISNDALGFVETCG